MRAGPGSKLISCGAPAGTWTQVPVPAPTSSVADHEAHLALEHEERLDVVGVGVRVGRRGALLGDDLGDRQRLDVAEQRSRWPSPSSVNPAPIAISLAGSRPSTPSGSCLVEVERLLVADAAHVAG